MSTDYLILSKFASFLLKNTLGAAIANKTPRIIITNTNSIRLNAFIMCKGFVNIAKNGV